MKQLCKDTGILALETCIQTPCYGISTLPSVLFQKALPYPRFIALYLLY